MPLATVESYFKKTEISYELLSGILESVQAAASQEWVGKLLVSLAKADNFEMTKMFLEDKEVTIIKSILSKLPNPYKD